jgi:hypothetical protein
MQSGLQTNQAGALLSSVIAVVVNNQRIADPQLDAIAMTAARRMIRMESLPKMGLAGYVGKIA